MSKLMTILACMFVTTCGLLASPIGEISRGIRTTEADSMASAVTQPRRLPQAIFVEGLGRTMSLASINYDRRLSRTYPALGMSVGISYLHISDAKFQNFRLMTVPVTLYYLLGKRKHYLELGTGLNLGFSTYQRKPGALVGDYIQGDLHRGRHEARYSFDIFGVSTIGYRYQPAGRGILFGVGVSPSYGYPDGFFSVSLLPYLRLGYAF